VEEAEVLLVCGSYHARSANRGVLDVARETLVATTHSVAESLSPARLPALCASQLEAPPDEVMAFRQHVDQARAFVIAGPEYAGGLAGSLKNALDWCVGADRGFYRKPVVVMSAGTTGGTHALKQLAQTLLWQGAHVIGHLGIAAPKTKSDSSGAIVDPATRAEIVALVSALIAAIDATEEHRQEISERTAESLGISHYPHQA
jgi:NAD(P)H-dependent FMN reductase